MIKAITSLRSATVLKAARGFGVALALNLAGCSILPQPVADPTRYYLLGTPARSEAAVSAPKGTLHVGLRGLELPPYLRNNRTMVVRSGANEIRYEDYARWAEPLDQAVQRVIRDRLLARDAVASAEIAPYSPQIRRDIDVVVRVLQCEGGQEGAGRKTVQFSANYEILDQRKDGAVVLRKNFTAPAADWDGNDFGRLASLLGAAAAALGDDIAANLPN